MPRRFVVLTFYSFAVFGLFGQSPQGIASPLVIDELLSSKINSSSQQTGVLSRQLGVFAPSKLVLLIPGFPGLINTDFKNGRWQGTDESSVVVRFRSELLDESTVTIVINCDSQPTAKPYCDSEYQASAAREIHIRRLLESVKKRFTNLKEVWIVGNSMGSIASMTVGIHNSDGYSGAVHIAAITNPLYKNIAPMLAGINLRDQKIPHFLIHHEKDLCTSTPYSGAVAVHKNQKIPLITVTGGMSLPGDPCRGQSPHGFMGSEKEMMRAIKDIIKIGRPTTLRIQ